MSRDLEAVIVGAALVVGLQLAWKLGRGAWRGWRTRNVRRVRWE